MCEPGRAILQNPISMIPNEAKLINLWVLYKNSTLILLVCLKNSYLGLLQIYNKKNKPLTINFYLILW